MAAAALNRAFASMMQQKLDVITAVGNGFASVSPVYGASVGMHLRHSLDHCVRVSLAVQSLNSSAETVPRLDYDGRERGTEVESNPEAAACLVRDLRDSVGSAIESDNSLIERSVLAEFALSDNPADGFQGIRSTLGRELAFVAHHSFHHMALIRLIALEHLQIPEQDLPPNLGKAPSTIMFLNRLQS